MLLQVTFWMVKYSPYRVMMLVHLYVKLLVRTINVAFWRRFFSG